MFQSERQNEQLFRITEGFAGVGFSFRRGEVIAVPADVTLPKTIAERSEPYLDQRPLDVTKFDLDSWLRNQLPRPEPPPAEPPMVEKELRRALGLTDDALWARARAACSRQALTSRVRVTDRGIETTVAYFPEPFRQWLASVRELAALVK